LGLPFGRLAEAGWRQRSCQPVVWAVTTPKVVIEGNCAAVGKRLVGSVVAEVVVEGIVGAVVEGTAAETLGTGAAVVGRSMLAWTRGADLPRDLGEHYKFDFLIELTCSIVPG